MNGANLNLIKILHKRISVSLINSLFSVRSRNLEALLYQLLLYKTLI